MEEITAILNGYKRPEYLEEQVQALRSQTIPPKEIWLWINRTPDKSVDFFGKTSGIDVVVDSSRNFKYHGRFALGLMAKTKYVAFFDDDTIPGRKWLETCIETKNNIPAAGYVPEPILGGAGVRLRSENYVDHVREGWPNPSVKPKLVDLVGHAWFLPQDYLRVLWRESPISLENGEDIQLSYLAQKYLDVDTYTTPHDPSDMNTWSSLKAWQYGADNKASSNGALMPIPEFYKQRDEIIQYAMAMGWRPLFTR